MRTTHNSIQMGSQRKKGAALKRVGTRARSRMEEFFDKRIFLETRVKVKSNWRQDESALSQWGYLNNR